jgi:DNA-binding IclR family transcriptional regulator
VAGVQSVERAFALLGCLAGGPAGVSELAARAGLPKSTVSRLLATLEQLGAVEHDTRGGAWRIGATLADLGRTASNGRDLVALARPHLVELSSLTGEAAGLSVLDTGDVHYLVQVAPDRAVNVRDWTGERVPAHVVSSGLVLLAHAPARAVDHYLAGPLRASTDRSMTDPAALRGRLRQVRERGFEWVHGEFAPEISSVAAPVRGAGGEVVAAMHVHGPSYRFPPDADAAAVAAHVVAAADRLSAAARPR